MTFPGSVKRVRPRQDTWHDTTRAWKAAIWTHGHCRDRAWMRDGVPSRDLALQVPLLCQAMADREKLLAVGAENDPANTMGLTERPGPRWSFLIRQQPGPFGRCGEFEAEPLLVDQVHELPLVREVPVVASAELFQHQTSGFAHAERVFEEIDQCLGRQRRGHRFQSRLRTAECGERSPRASQPCGRGRHTQQTLTGCG